MFKTAVVVWVFYIATSFWTGAQDTLKFTMNAHNNIVLTAILNNEDTVPLMLHTGISDLSIIENRCPNIQWSDSVNVESWGGSSDARVSTSNTLRLGNMEWTDIPIWECRHSGPNTDGKVGLPFFAGSFVTFDFDNSQLIIQQELPKEISSFTKCPIYTDGDEIFVELSVKINGKNLEQRFLLHSGYGGCLLVDDEFAKKHRLTKKLEIVDQSVLKDSYGNSITVNKAVAPIVMWDSFALDDVPVGFFSGKIAQQHISVLGADFLKRFQLIVDANREFIYIKPSKYWEEEYSKI